MDIILKRTEDGVETNVIHFCRADGVGCHSPTGFEWGYGGSGPSDLAYNILRTIGLPIPKAQALYHHFKRAFIESMPHEGRTIKEAEIWQWINEMRKED